MAKRINCLGHCPARGTMTRPEARRGYTQRNVVSTEVDCVNATATWGWCDDRPKDFAGNALAGQATSPWITGHLSSLLQGAPNQQNFQKSR
jgi:hypothetical protein